MISCPVFFSSNPLVKLRAGIVGSGIGQIFWSQPYSKHLFSEQANKVYTGARHKRIQHQKRIIPGSITTKRWNAQSLNCFSRQYGMDFIIANNSIRKTSDVYRKEIKVNNIECIQDALLNLINRVANRKTMNLAKAKCHMAWPCKQTLFYSKLYALFRPRSYLSSDGVLSYSKCISQKSNKRGKTTCNDHFQDVIYGCVHRRSSWYKDKSNHSRFPNGTLKIPRLS